MLQYQLKHEVKLLGFKFRLGLIWVWAVGIDLMPAKTGEMKSDYTDNDLLQP